MIHRDIKPENVMVTENGRVKLIDFGLSRASRTKKLTTVTGTPYYISPEVLKGKYHAESDIWSMGVLLYFLVSGLKPFEGDTREELFGKISKSQFDFNRDEFKKVSAECKDLITKLLKKESKKRITGK